MTTLSAFPKLEAAGFDLAFTYHASAILAVHFTDAAAELDDIASSVQIPISEIIAGGGGEAKLTQRLRKALHARGWEKRNFAVEKRIDSKLSFATSHEVDHVKEFSDGTIALEIEWNNKDPFFDRDLEHFQRLHADGAISIGVVITRGSTIQDGIEELIRQYAYQHGLDSPEALKAAGIARTRRQSEDVERRAQRRGIPFQDAWARSFKGDKFGAATTHWAKLEDRLDRGVGSPCPLVAIGIPISCVTT